MKTLTIMRHAKSSWDDPELSDHDRPLNARGAKAAAAMAARLKAEGYRPDLVLVSSARRTQSTAEALQTVYGGKLEMRIEPGLYEAGPERYEALVRQTGSEVEHLMIVGHNPAAEILAEMLGGHSYRMATAAYLRVEIPGAWKDFTLGPCTVVAYDLPKSRK